MFSRNQVFCPKNWKLWRTPTTVDFNGFCWNFAHVPYLPMFTKAWVGFFLVFGNEKINNRFVISRFIYSQPRFNCFLQSLSLSITWVICQNQKIPGFCTLTETRFINNSRSKQNLKNPTHYFVDIRKTETCAKFQQKIIDFTVVEARQSFQFFRQINLVSRK